MNPIIRFILIFLVLILSTNSFSQGWERFFGDGPNALKEEQANCVYQTKNGDILIAGYIREYSPFYSHAQIIKTNTNGDTLWKRIYDLADSKGISILETIDSGIILGGQIVIGSRFHDFILKTDSEGNTIWQKTDSLKTELKELEQTSDGGFVSISTIDTTQFRSYLKRFDTYGNLLWSKRFGDSLFSTNSVKETDDKGFIILGTQYILDNNGFWVNSNTHLIKTDSLGNVVWERAFNENQIHIGESISQANDNGYVLTGQTSNYDNLTNAFVIRTDSLGNKLWERIYRNDFNEYSIGNSIQVGNDDNFIVAGAKGKKVYYTDAYLFKINSINGDLIWERTFGTDSTTDWARSVKVNSDGSLIVVGTKNATDQLQLGDFYLIKTDENGFIGNVTTISQLEKKSIHLYPNPASSNIIIESEDLFINRIILNSIDGKKVLEAAITHQNRVEIDIQELPKGIYYLNCISEKSSQVFKVVKQ